MFLEASSNRSVCLSIAVNKLIFNELLAKFSSSADIAPVKDLRVEAPLATKSLTLLDAPDNLSPNNPESLKLVFKA